MELSAHITHRFNNLECLLISDGEKFPQNVVYSKDGLRLYSRIFFRFNRLQCCCWGPTRPENEQGRVEAGSARLTTSYVTQYRLLSFNFRNHKNTSLDISRPLTPHLSHTCNFMMGALIHHKLSVTAG